MTPEMYRRHAQMEDTHWWFEGRRRVIDRVLRAHLVPTPHRHILDVGCGTGGMFPLLQRYGEVEGAEPSDDGRRFLKERFPQVKVHPCALPDGLPKGTWQLVTMFDVLEHLEEPVEALRALRSRTSSTGQLILTVPALQSLWSKHDEVNHHHRRYRRTQLIAQLSAGGFAVTHSSYFNSTLLPAVAAVRIAQRLVPALDRGEGDLKATPEPFNAVLTKILGLEGAVASRLGFPLGVSLIAVARRA